MKLIYTSLFLLLSYCSFANYYTPGTGVKYTLNDLVTNSGGAVTLTAGEYIVTDIIFISATDTLSITTNATVKYAVNTYLDVNGVLLINPPTNVTFTAVEQATGFNGMRIDSSNATVIKKLTFEYAVSMRITDCSPTLDSCVLQYNNIGTSTTFGNGALAVFRANPVITNCKFLNNRRAAIQGGSNISNAPKIIGNLFYGNGSMNVNVPQINLGATSSGNDTVKIINNQIIGVPAAIQSGGIGFLPIGNVYTIITGNVIKNNRYGITFSGGSNINAIVSYNVIDSNNIQGNSNLGGSGIAFAGGSASSHQNTIVTGNHIGWNLWGITIQNFAQPNLGNLTNADTTDDGKNYFIDNNNATTPFTDLYNNSPDPIFAQGNYWGSDDVSVVETKIFHQPDLASLGLVNYTNFITLPIKIESFSATIKEKNVLLKWQSSTEINSDYFVIEKSVDGRNFTSIQTLKANGVASNYSCTDRDVEQNKTLYYKLRMVDKDGSFTYSKIIAIQLNSITKTEIIKLYPTVITSNELTAEITSSKDQKVAIQFFNAEGKQLSQTNENIVTGKNIVTIHANNNFPNGTIYVRFSGETFYQTVTLIKQ